jgi:hypothetical protein
LMKLQSQGWVGFHCLPSLSQGFIIFSEANCT